MLSTYTPQRRPSWRGVIAGLVMGMIVVMAMIALALVLSSFLPFDLKGTSIAGGIYAAVTALVSAFVAGYFAIKFSAPEALFGDGTDIDPKDATLTGMLTAALIVLLTTFFTLSSATGILATAGKVAGSTVSTVAKTAGAGAAAVGSASENDGLQQKAKEVYNSVSGDITEENIQMMMAKNTEDLSEQQIAATSSVIKDMLSNTKAQVEDMDFTDIDTWRNIDDYTKQRMDSIEKTMQGPELITRLQQEGLTEAQAIDVRTEIQQSFDEYKAKTEQTISESKQLAEEKLQQAEDVARKAALYSGLFWLISTLLTFIAATMGARSAASKYRLAKPMVTLNDNVR